MSVILLAHVFSCMWIAIGKWDSEGWVERFITQVRIDQNNPDLSTYDFFISIYINAFYFTLTTITTVGYGDISGKTLIEFIFSMIVEFFGLSFFSLMSGTVGVMFSGN